MYNYNMEIKEKEGTLVEFKQEVNVEKIKKEIAAISNAMNKDDVGKIFIFVDDEGNYNVDAKPTKEDDQALITICNWGIAFGLMIEQKWMNGYFILSFEFTSAIIKLDDQGIYFRSGSSSVPANQQMMETITQKKFNNIVSFVGDRKEYTFKSLERKMAEARAKFDGDFMESFSIKKGDKITNIGAKLSDQDRTNILINDKVVNKPLIELFEYFENEVKAWFAATPLVTSSQRKRNSDSVSWEILRELFWNAVAHGNLISDPLAEIEFTEGKITFKNVSINKSDLVKRLESSDNLSHIPPQRPWFDLLRACYLVEGRNIGLKKIRTEAHNQNKYMVRIWFEGPKFVIDIVTGLDEKSEKGKYKKIWGK